ncbi:NAD(P)/FAD-dependent oxidoreductase [Dehalogenimonas sp. THU2]|uniref:dihydrolipoyl dehydrogenase family protein n=1 Tax=Dehalogenimonas sp. THU2 TaxID=3151121 RepID=UPI003218B69B
MPNEYDLVVIGSGSAGRSAAFRCRAAGWRVAVIDQLPFGGTCALRGCDPKKVLIGAADALDQVKRFSGLGVKAETLDINWPELMAFKRTFTGPMPGEIEKGLHDRGIDTYRGSARFTGRNAVAVSGEVLEGRFILIAAGAEPMKLGIDGEEHLTTSDQFLELEQLPDRVLFVGGGYIGFEFAHLSRRAGAEVTMLEMSDHFLGPFDRDMVAMLLKKTRGIGIDARTGTAVKSIEKSDQGFTVHAVAGDRELRFEVDLAVHAAGRVPALMNLDLDSAGIEHESGRLKLNDYLQSLSNPSVYAAGDVTKKGPALTPVAGIDGDAVAANMLEGNRVSPDYSVVASAVFTIPPLASVGLTEEQAKERGLKFKVNHADTAAWYTSHRLNEDTSGYKVMVEEGSGRIIGAHLLGPHSDEVINIFALAMKAGLPAEKVKETLFTYPTASSDIGYML